MNTTTINGISIPAPSAPLAGSPDAPAKLDRLKNFHTRYELAMIRGDVSILIRYTSNKSRRSLYDCVSDYAETITTIAGSPEIHFAKKSADGATIGDWAIRFTGRTQREALLSGELPFIGRCQKAE